MKHFTMKTLPEDEQPYEKAREYGVAALTDTELLAVLLRAGTKGKTSLALARDILTSIDNDTHLLNIHHLTYEQLTSKKGIGNVKAIQILCLSEISKRLAKATAKEGVLLNNPAAIAAYYMEDMRHLSQEQMKLLMFDTKSKKLLELERMVLDAAEYHFDNRCILLTVTEEMQAKTGCCGPDLEGISIISQSVEGVKVGITLKQTDAEVFRLSVRTYEPLDASIRCKRLGGGGHKSAAGATLNGTLDEVKKQLLDVVGQTMEEAYAGVSVTE